jgi:hypothetical protein
VESATNWIQAIAAVAALFIGVAAFRVSLRQGKLNDAQIALAEVLKKSAEIQDEFAKGQNEYARSQRELNEQLAVLEKWRKTPLPVPVKVQWNADQSELSFTLVNGGGGAATDIWIESVLVLVPTIRSDSPVAAAPVPPLVPVFVGQRLDYLRDSIPVVVPCSSGQFPLGVEKIVALTGEGDCVGKRVEIRYEVESDGVETLQRLASKLVR